MQRPAMRFAMLASVIMFIVGGSLLIPVFAGPHTHERLASLVSLNLPLASAFLALGLPTSLYAQWHMRRERPTQAVSGRGRHTALWAALLVFALPLTAIAVVLIAHGYPGTFVSLSLTVACLLCCVVGLIRISLKPHPLHSA